MISGAMTTSLTTLLLLAPLAALDDWPQFRGPGGRSVAVGEAPIPRAMGPEESVLWKAPLPGGHSSPCVIGDRIVVTGSDDATHDVVVCLARESGAELWRVRFEREEPPQYAHVDAVPALPSPCSDGEHVYVYFGGYGLIALDMEGEVAWEKRMPHPGYNFGVGPSPLLVGDLVILPRDGAPEAALLAFDKKTGEQRWSVDRFSYFESHGTPFLWRNSQREELIVGSSARLCSFDPASGDLLWTYAGITVFPCTTATAVGDTLYFAAWSTPNSSGRGFWDAGFGRTLELSDEEVADPAILFRRLDTNKDGRVTPEEVPECRAKDAFNFIDVDGNGTWEEAELTGATKGPKAPGRNVMLAIPAGGEGMLMKEDLAWTYTRGLPYVASPLVHEGRVWLFKSGGVVTCLDAGTGEVVFGRSRLSDRSEYYLSPVAAGDLILAGSAEGTFYLLDARADELKVVHEVQFDGELFATPAVIDGVVYLRTKDTLYAFGSAGD